MPRWQPAHAAVVAAFVVLAVACGSVSDGAHSNVLLVTGTLTATIPATAKCYDVRNTGGFGYHAEASGSSTYVEVGIPWKKSTGSFNLVPLSGAHFEQDGASWAVTSGAFHIDEFDGASAAGRLDADFVLPRDSTKTIHVVSAWSCKVMPFVVN